MEQGLRQHVDAVLLALEHAQAVFGGATVPVDPPAFSPPARLEDDLGLGQY